MYCHTVCTVVDYTDICRHSRWLRGYDVGIVNDYTKYIGIEYAEMTMTSQSSTANFKDLSLTLKEHLAKLKYLGVFTYPIANFLTFENLGYQRLK